MKARKRTRTRGGHPLRVAIVGAGKVGTVLGRVMAEEGAQVTAVISRSRSSARSAGRFIGCRTVSTALTAIPSETDVVLIATPHEAVEEVARTLARLEGLEFRRLAVCHASGMLTASALEPLAVRGATVFSFHPLQTFPRDFAPQKIIPNARGIWYGVDGRPAGIRMAQRLARLLKGHVLEVPEHLRAFYHAACVVASNHLTTLLSEVETMFGVISGRGAGFFPVFRPILEATLHNVSRSGPAAALSGPIARGGVETVAQHLAAVSEYAPAVIPYFTRLSLETVRLASAKGSIDAQRGEALEQLIRSYMADTLPVKENL